MYRKHRYILSLFFSLTFFVLNAQHEADYWYFGNYAGLDFSSGNPEPVSNGELQSDEGCAVISDSAGNLLFYTNGVTVWNRTHQIMENGTDLMGDSSSTQSAVVVPYPDNDSLFYIFTVDILYDQNNPGHQHKGFRYSIVNMKKDNSLGEIVSKNISLLDSVCQKISAVYHQNGKDIWILTHKWGNDKFYTWLINENGLNTSPIISSAGSVHFSTDIYYAAAIGYMKSSSLGNKIVVGILALLKYEVFDFNNLNGVVSNPIPLTLTTNNAYGCEFSPDGSKLYFTELRKVHQVDMNAGTPIDIINSMTEIHEFTDAPGALQLAKNGKLYITNLNSEYLSVINDPNELPADCNFELNAVYLDGRIAQFGLPNFIQSYFKEPDFRIENSCVFDDTQFFIENITDIDSVIWDFGDPISGSQNISRDLSPVHVYSEPGIYNVTLTVWFNNVSSEHHEDIKIVALPELNLGNDTTFCLIDSYILNAYGHHLNYLWNDLSTESYLEVQNDGSYWVEVENIYTTCKNSDTINIVFSDSPEINLGNDTSFCENTSFFIDAYHDGYTYLWQDNSVESFYSAVDEGTFYVIVTNEFGCVNSDTIYLSLKYLPRFSFPVDTVLCEGTVLNLTYDFDDTDYVWQDGSADNSFLISEEGFYRLITENSCGMWSDSLDVEYRYCGEIYIPNVYSPNNDDINDLFLIKGIDGEDWQLIIYNRWGQEVIKYDSYVNTWEGRDKFGNELSSGVYYYILRNSQDGLLYRGTVRIVN